MAQQEIRGGGEDISLFGERPSFPRSGRFFTCVGVYNTCHLFIKINSSF